MGDSEFNIILYNDDYDPNSTVSLVILYELRFVAINWAAQIYQNSQRGFQGTRIPFCETLLVFAEIDVFINYDSTRTRRNSFFSRFYLKPLVTKLIVYALGQCWKKLLCNPLMLVGFKGSLQWFCKKSLYNRILVVKILHIQQIARVSVAGAWKNFTKSACRTPSNCWVFLLKLKQTIFSNTKHVSIKVGEHPKNWQMVS